jgi:hypothetical protein
LIRWLGLRLEITGAIIVLCAALSTVLNRKEMTEGKVGLAISFALNVSIYKSYNKVKLLF